MFYRVSEEKEESVQRLKNEQGNSERKIQQLEQQNLIIEQERKSILFKLQANNVALDYIFIFTVGNLEGEKRLRVVFERNNRTVDVFRKYTG